MPQPIVPLRLAPKQWSCALLESTVNISLTVDISNDKPQIHLKVSFGVYTSKEEARPCGIFLYTVWVYVVVTGLMKTLTDQKLNRIRLGRWEILMWGSLSREQQTTVLAWLGIRSKSSISKPVPQKAVPAGNWPWFCKLATKSGNPPADWTRYLRG